ncbi:hypothetical protein LCGC14_1785700 [marine sediment metagenome]|uniref:Ice-binding protein C-terminal domain-containing protein n=1 Tax=marine sediment metagenome TaxID=412755 RepID=A0A0F9HGL3_9ZZZZ
MRRVILCAVVVMIADTGRADFILSGSEHLEVDSLHDVGILYDSSTANVVAGGRIASVYVNDAGGLINSGGAIAWLRAYDTGSVEFSAGTFNKLDAYETSNVVISGGELYGSLSAYDGSSVIISGGELGSLSVEDNSTAEVSGGVVSILAGLETSIVTFRGYDFRATAGLRLENDTVLGTGILTGKWFDKTPWIVDIRQNRATIRVVPEPSTLALLAMGAIGLLSYVWRQQKRRAF